MTANGPALTWMEPGDPLPDPERAWGRHSEAPGLLAAGGDLRPQTLRDAYSHGIFPWFSEGQPILWWSPDPRMTLKVADFKLHRSFRKTLGKFRRSSDCEVRIDTAFRQVIQACAETPRGSQNGTWILPEMVEAYCQWHAQGFVHSVETWIGGKLVGGLYCVSLGHAVFGESMFSLEDDASKIALAALVALSRQAGVGLIDCQQNTKHLASMGAQEMSRKDFLGFVAPAVLAGEVCWRFDPLYWNLVLSA